MDRFPQPSIRADRLSLAIEQARDPYEYGAEMIEDCIAKLKIQSKGACDPGWFDSALDLLDDARGELLAGADRAQDAAVEEAA